MEQFDNVLSWAVDLEDEAHSKMLIIRDIDIQDNDNQPAVFHMADVLCATTLNSQVYCRHEYHLYDAPFRVVPNIDPKFVPLLDGVQPHILTFEYMDVLAAGSSDILEGSERFHLYKIQNAHHFFDVGIFFRMKENTLNFLDLFSLKILCRTLGKFFLYICGLENFSQRLVLAFQS